MPIYAIFKSYNIVLHQSKYADLYEKLISQPDLNLDYSESHHIVPRSLGGDDSPSNLVRLSARKHFLCHYLLCKMVTTNSKSWHSMVKAFNMMSASSKNMTRYFNSRLYEYARKNMSSIMSQLQDGKGNSQYGTIWVNRPSTMESIKINKNDVDLYLALGFFIGQKYKWKVKEASYKKWAHRKSSEYRTRLSKIYSDTNKKSKRCFVHGTEYISLSEASKALGILHETLRMRIKSKSFPDCYWL